MVYFISNDLLQFNCVDCSMLVPKKVRGHSYDPLQVRMVPVLSSFAPYLEDAAFSVHSGLT